MQLSKKVNTFSQFFSAFLKSTLNLKHSKKKKTISLIAYVFPKLQTAKYVLMYLSKE